MSYYVWHSYYVVFVYFSSREHTFLPALPICIIVKSDQVLKYTQTHHSAHNKQNLIEIGFDILLVWGSVGGEEGAGQQGQRQNQTDVVVNLQESNKIIVVISFDGSENYLNFSNHIFNLDEFSFMRKHFTYTLLLLKICKFLWVI